jgi:hypothetical protein
LAIFLIVPSGFLLLAALGAKPEIPHLKILFTLQRRKRKKEIISSNLVDLRLACDLHIGVDRATGHNIWCFMELSPPKPKL